MNNSPRHFFITVAAILFLCTFFNNLTATSVNDPVERFDCRLYWKPPGRVSLVSAVTGRFRDKFNEFYHVGLDIGPSFKISDRFQLTTVLRSESRKKTDGWMNYELVLIDPAARIWQAGNWRFDFRARFQYQFRPTNMLHLRLKPQITRYVLIGSKKSKIFISNDFYIPLGHNAVANHTDYNFFVSGIQIPLGVRTHIEPAYKLFSSRKDEPGASWSHSHQMTFAFGYTI